MAVIRDCFFTSIALNYLSKALALASSVFEVYPQSRFVISLIDYRLLSEAQIRLLENLKIEFRKEGQELSFVDPLTMYERPDLLIYKFNIIEACTAVKPAVASMLLETAEVVTYLDPDTILYSCFPDNMSDAWEFQVTPHVIAPAKKTSLVSERLFMCYGTFNLGYFAVRKSVDTKSFLRWWQDFCVNYGADAPQAGLFVDQKPVDLLPSFVERVQVLRHPGCNVAWWNIFCDLREIESGGRVSFEGQKWPLIFYHFSSLHHEKDITKRKVSNQFANHGKSDEGEDTLLASSPELAALFVDYDRRVEALSHRCREIGRVEIPKSSQASLSVRLLLAEALRRGMDYRGDPALDSKHIVGWRCSKYLLSHVSKRDLKAILTAFLSMMSFILTPSLLQLIRKN